MDVELQDLTEVFCASLEQIRARGYEGLVPVAAGMCRRMQARCLIHPHEVPLPGMEPWAALEASAAAWPTPNTEPRFLARC